MKVFIACYDGTDTNDILGAFTNLEKAKEAIHEDYEKTEFGYVPDYREICDNHIYVAKTGNWFDEWYIVETELQN